MDNSTPLVSLVLCTVNRTYEVLEYLKSVWPGDRNVELVIVDQNESSENISNFLQEQRNIFHRVIHVRKDKSSLSSARNYGMHYCSGIFLGFPDDDCRYDNELLTEVVNKLLALETTPKNPNCLGIAVSFPGCSTLATKERIYWNKLPGKVISFSFFIRRTNVHNHYSTNTLFDERLGVGCYFGAGEETDYLFRRMGVNCYLLAIPELKVFHPEKKCSSLLRELSYGRGFGALVAFNIFRRGLPFLPLATKIMLGPFFRIILEIIRMRFKRVSFPAVSLFGRWQGLLIALCTKNNR